jgi:hypothetical protein
MRIRPDRNARAALALGLLAMAVTASGVSRAQDAPPPPVDQFAQICGLKDRETQRLPGEDVAAGGAPALFTNDLNRATVSRVVRFGDRYAMRAIMPSSADPQHADVVKCVLAFEGASLDDMVGLLSTTLSAKPASHSTADFAFLNLERDTFFVRRGPDRWVSIVRMDVLMKNIDPGYLKKGAKPVPGPIIE